MGWRPNGYAAGAKPSAARRREYRGGHAFGVHQKAVHDEVERQQEAVDKKLKRDLHQPLPEIWTFKKDRGSYTAGRWEVDVRRNARGQFAKALSDQQKAAKLGLITGRDLK